MTPDQLADLMARATRPRRTVPIVLDGDLRAAVEERLLELESLTGSAENETDRRLGSAPRVNARAAELDADLDQLLAEAEGATLNVVIEGLPGTAWDAFRALHPPRPDVKVDQLWRVNIEEGRTPLIGQTAVGYRDGDEVRPWADGQLDWLIDFCTDWQRDKLLLAALETCRGDDAVPLPRARSTTETSAAG